MPRKQVGRRTQEVAQTITKDPNDRRAIPADVLAVVRSNAKGAVTRMQAILEDDSAWGKDGWLSHNMQIKLAEVAMDRSFGKPEQVKTDGTGAGSISADSVVGIVEALYRRMQGELPERRGGGPAEDGKTVEATPVAVEDAVEESAAEALRRRAAARYGSAGDTVNGVRQTPRPQVRGRRRGAGGD